MKYTNQEIFDKVKTHLLTQNKKSLMGTMTFSCAYRGADNTKCAFGIFIEDDEYKPEFEDCAIPNLETPVLSIDDNKFVNFRNFVLSKFEPEQVPLLRELQNIHDNYNVGQWTDLLHNVAVNHGLTP